MILVIKKDDNLKTHQDIIRDALSENTGIVEIGNLSKEPEKELYDETCENALKAINTVFKDIINGDCNNLKGEDLNNLVEALNKL